MSRIDRLTICASPKASCRSVADFAWEVAQSTQLCSPLRARLLVFRNPLRRLVSAYLNKYVEHSKYRQASLQLCPQAQLDSFADFVAELDQHGFRCVDRTHFHPQIRRYRHQRFDRVFNSEDLQPLQEFVNRLFETEVSMPFRVRANHPGVVRDQADAPGGSGAPERSTSLAHTPATELRELLAGGRSPGYRRFYDAELEAKARRIYRSDLRFLDRALQQRLLTPDLHARLSAL